MYCGETAGRIKMPLGRETGLVPGYIVLDGDPDKKEHSTPATFPAMSFVAKVLLTGMEVAAALATLC